MHLDAAGHGTKRESLRSVAMKLTGHKTENVYRRYAIVSEADLDSAAVRLAEAASRSASRSTASA